MSNLLSYLKPFFLGWFATYGPVSDTYTHHACAALKSRLHLENTIILSANHVSGPVNVSTPGPCQSHALVSTSICRVRFVVNTTPTSAVHAEVWLPDTWFGRFLASGNGGLGGCIDYAQLDYGTSFHFATVASNNGHNGTMFDGIAFLHDPEVINDFAFRGTHVSAVIGKQIVHAYYREPAQRSYYTGCSAGGRQGMQEALKFPEDFDGIIAGAPAVDWNHLLGWGGMLGRHVGAPHGNKSESYIPPALWDVVAEEVLNQCDELDGVKDGIITEPDVCHFRPEAIQCRGQNGTKCLSRPQVEALRKIYRPLYGRHGEFLFPRYDPGAEADGNAQAAFSGEISGITRLCYNWYKYAILNVSRYDFSNFGLNDIALADTIDPGGISTWSGDLSSFKTRGGKFLTYHGRRDEYIASGNSKRMYKLVSKTLNMPSLDPFYRLFLIPGMNHCAGGPGAWSFGQVKPLPKVVNDSSHNILLAMVDWVERGVAPETIIGTGSDGARREHCRYPRSRSVWNGTAFECRP
ncbi:putative tannase and feruloyl esterase [Lyophyllum shimeji]|uniref:Carboxylic ester hydrolase n=1 Tax=Lyophyllum shimeji TaxID=47721 RepID=A0A9P3PQF1_LYOSH|nr:putative tannase and feruloyl esterase [Lyophyllum shimeji]